jgi:hypothetical protein
VASVGLDIFLLLKKNKQTRKVWLLLGKNKQMQKATIRDLQEVCSPPSNSDYDAKLPFPAKFALPYALTRERFEKIHHGNFYVSMKPNGLHASLSFCGGLLWIKDRSAQIWRHKQAQVDSKWHVCLDVELFVKQNELIAFAFDMTHCNGQSLANEAFVKRYSALLAWIRENTAHVKGLHLMLKPFVPWKQSARLWQQTEFACSFGTVPIDESGFILIEKDSPYIPKNDLQLLKFKKHHTIDLELEDQKRAFWMDEYGQKQRLPVVDVPSDAKGGTIAEFRLDEKSNKWTFQEMRLEKKRPNAPATIRDALCESSTQKRLRISDILVLFTPKKFEDVS